MGKRRNPDQAETAGEEENTQDITPGTWTEFFTGNLFQVGVSFLPQMCKNGLRGGTAVLTCTIPELWSNHRSPVPGPATATRVLSPN